MRAAVIPYKGENWPVSPEWADKHLAGAFADLPQWETGEQGDSAAPFDPEQPALWPRLWAILRKSDETFAQRTKGLSHREVAALMLYAADLSEERRAELLALEPDALLAKFKLTHEDVREWAPDPELTAKARAITETLTPEELRELRAVEAHIIVRNRIDALLGRDLSEFEIDFVDLAKPQGIGGFPCGCELTTVVDLDAVERAAKLLEQGVTPNFTTQHAHYPRKLCPRHASLMVTLAASGALSDKLAHINGSIMNDQPVAEAA